MSRTLLLALVLALCSCSSDARSGSIPEGTLQPVKGTTTANLQLTTDRDSSSSRRLQQAVSTTTFSSSGATCPSGAKAVPGCVETPKPEYTCAVIDCMPTKTCAMFTCEGKCVPLCVDPEEAESCPPGVPVVRCPYNPCAATTCKVDTTCVTRRCGKCTAECVDSAPSPTPDPATSICFVGKPVECFVDPCQTKNCTADRFCASEYCGGCNAACLLREPRCSSGMERRPCLGTANGCITAKFCCGITCVPDQCNDCAATGVGPCKPGRYVNRELAACRLCPRGYACAGGTNTTVTALPKPCNDGKYANVRGLATCKQCPAGTTTPATPAKKGYTACS